MHLVVTQLWRSSFPINRSVGNHDTVHDICEVPAIPQARAVVDGLDGWRPLPALLSASDIVSLHIPLTDQTAGLLDAAALASMPSDAVLVNTSRGGVVDEDALVAALQSGGLAAAGLDVFAAEPIPAGNVLLTQPNVVLTPHVTWYTLDTMRRYLTEAVDNCARLRDGRGLANVVNGIVVPNRPVNREEPPLR